MIVSVNQKTPGAHNAHSNSDPLAIKMKSNSTHPFAAALETMYGSYGGQWPPRGSFEDWPKSFAIYQEIADEMPTKMAELNDVQKLRAWMRKGLDKVDLIDVIHHMDNHLAHDDAILLGFAALLAFLANAYRWGTAPPTEEERQRTHLEFPEKLWTPFEKTNDFYGLAQRSTVFTLVIGNCTYKDGVPAGMQFCFNADPYIVKTEKNFFLACVQTETTFKPAFQMMANYLILTEDARESHESAKQLLRRRVQLLQDIKKVLAAVSRMFYNYMKDTVISRDIWVDYVQSVTGWNLNGEEGGASGGEFLTFHCLDEFLGTSGKGVIYQAILRKRLGTPHLYRNCMEALGDESRSYRFNSFLDLPGEADPLQKAKDDLISMLYTWRLHHSKIAHRYLEKSNMTSGGTINRVRHRGETIAMRGQKELRERARETGQYISTVIKPDCKPLQVISEINFFNSICSLVKNTKVICSVLIVCSLAIAVHGFNF